MATRQASGVIQYLRRTALLRDGAGLTDGQLLTDYLSRRDEAALEALVRRHGPMVWGVCRRVLCNYHDAEDAFQATFLVLVRKAASIGSRELLANWLYGVAHKTALKARATVGRRKQRERQVTPMPEPVSKDSGVRIQGSGVRSQESGISHPEWKELQALLDEELSRLPDKYRVVIVLCDLEGKTRKEAARQLGCPEGTVAGRLSRARVMLAKRLARRGVVLSGGVLAAVLSQNVASAGVPIALVSATIKAASLLAAGQAATAGAISVKVAALSEGVLRTMLLKKFKAAAAYLAITLILMLGSAMGFRTLAAENEPTNKEQGKLRDTLLVLDKQFWEASSKHDIETLNKLIAADYLGIGTNQRWTKTALLQQHKDFRTGDLQLVTNREVIRLSEHAALLSYEAKFKVFTKSGALSDTAHQHMIACWVQRDGGWFVVFSQVTDVVRPPGQTEGLAAKVSPQDEAAKWNAAILPPFQPVVNIKPAVKGDLGFILTKDDNHSLVFTVRLLPRTVRIGMLANPAWPEDPQDYVFVDLHLLERGKDEAKLADLKKGIPLTSSGLERASEVVVDGVLRAVESKEDGTTTLELNIPTLATVEKMAVDGILRAKEIKVVIDGKPGKLADLKTGISISMRLAKVTDWSVIVEIRAGKAVQSLQPKSH
jgi:RNA polymerase sigma factor (sigma-70 family)